MPRPIVNEIMEDGRKGAGTLFLMALEHLEKQDDAYVLDAAKRLYQERPAMANFANLYNWVLNARDEGRPLGTMLSDIRHGINAEIDEAVSLARKEVAFPVTILSNSSAVVRTLSSGVSGRVHQLRGEPVGEGLDSLDEIITGNDSIEGRLLVDSNMKYAVERSKTVLLGTDFIGDEYFLNKTGTYPLCLLAQKRDVKVIVVGDPSKVAPEGIEPMVLAKDPTEVSKRVVPGVEALNFYFERTPLQWVDSLIIGDQKCSSGDDLPRTMAHPRLKEICGKMKNTTMT